MSLLYLTPVIAISYKSICFILQSSLLYYTIANIIHTNLHFMVAKPAKIFILQPFLKIFLQTVYIKTRYYRAFRRGNAKAYALLHPTFGT